MKTRAARICLASAVVMWAVSTQAGEPALEVLRVAGAVDHCPIGGFCGADATCPAGLEIIGGGVAIVQGTLVSLEDNISFEVWYNQDGDAGAAAQAYALCAATPAGFVQRDWPGQCADGEAFCTMDVECPLQTVALSAGIYASRTRLMQLSPGEGRVWHFGWFEDGNGVRSSLWLHCASLPPGYEVIRGVAQSCAVGDTCSDEARCSDGKVLVGGGFDGAESEIVTTAPASTTTWHVAWRAAVQPFGDAAQGLGQAVAVCASGSGVDDPLHASGFEPPLSLLTGTTP